MILKTIVLTNFRKFKHVSIEFPDGILGVIGLNGVGKSTLFEAVSWVLYGPVAARTSTDHIKREGVAPSDPCRVELEFVFDNDSYRVVREIVGKQSSPSATVLVNGRIAASGADPVTKFIEKKLGMDFKSFFTSIYTKQKELNILSAMNTSERRILLLRMLGIDAIDKAIKEIGSDHRTANALIDKLRYDLVDAQGRKKIDVYTEELKSVEDQTRKAQQHLSEITKKITSGKQEVKNAEDLCHKHKQDYETTRKKFETLTEHKQLYEKKQRIQDELKEIQERVDERKIRTKELEQKLKTFGDLIHEIKTIDTKLKSLNEKRVQSLQTTEQNKTVLQTKKQEITDLEEKKNTIKDMGADAECPTCERVLGKQYQVLVKKYEKDIQLKEKEIKQLADQVFATQENYAIVSKEEAAFQKKKDYYQKLFREQERIQSTATQLQQELQRETKEYAFKDKQLKDIKLPTFNAADYEHVKNLVEKTYTTYQTALKTLDQKKDLFNKITRESDRQENEIRLLKQQTTTLQRFIAEQKTHAKRLAEEQTKTSHLKMLSDLMALFRTTLITRIRPTLSTYASDFFERLTDGKYKEIELDEDYNIQVYDDGTCYPINRFSGGEEDLANLCLRLAVSEVIMERSGGAFNFIILDEIFGSQDNIRRQNIMKALHGLSAKFRQIFLITHIEDVKHDMEHTLTVKEDESGISTVYLE